MIAVIAEMAQQAVGGWQANLIGQQFKGESSDLPDGMLVGQNNGQLYGIGIAGQVIQQISVVINRIPDQSGNGAFGGCYVFVLQDRFNQFRNFFVNHVCPPQDGFS